MKCEDLFGSGMGDDTTSSVWVEMDMSVSLSGGSVLVTVADVESCVKLTKLVADCIESRELRGEISVKDLDYLAQVQFEMVLAATVLGGRIKAERERHALSSTVVPFLGSVSS